MLKYDIKDYLVEENVNSPNTYFFNFYVSTYISKMYFK